MNYCSQPDHDVPAIRCGYPLPCPWHTAVIDVGAEPPTVTIPLTGPVDRLVELREIGRVLAGRETGNPRPENRPSRRKPQRRRPKGR